MNQKPSARYRFLSLLLSASLTLCSVEPAFSQVRAIAVESFGAPSGQLALPRNSSLAPLALSGTSGLGLNNSITPFAAAPSWSAASLPTAAAASASPVLTPAAALAAAPVPAAAEISAAVPASLEVPTAAARQDVVSLRNLARPAGPNDAQDGINGSRFFDNALRRAASAFAVAGFYRAAGSTLEPHANAAPDASAVEPAQPPSPEPSKLRSRVTKVLWGAGALALPLLAFGWMPFIHSNPANDAPVAAFTDWGAIARGVAFAGPLMLLGAWEAVKLYRSKHPGSLAWMGRMTVAKDLHKPFLPRLGHYVANLLFGAVGIGMVAVFAGPHINDWNHFLDAHNIGLLRWLHVGGWKNVVAAITILDFMGWWWHYACHRFPLMWRLHKVHHSDMEYDFSTTYRTHWAEMAAELAGRMVMYALVGPTLLTITIYEIIILALSQYQHSNVRMPARWEEALSRFFLTSHKHFIHHSLEIDDYDTNYGFIFACWDKMFGTFKSYNPEHLSTKIYTGVREYPRAQDLTFFKLMWMPFRSQKYPTKEKP
jgi:sterol desaturase/sphingolipid hydroxylase (fatty acid hydroxylase superfamily)